MLAVLATESLYGRSRVRTEGSFTLDKVKRECLIDAENKIGRTISYLLTGFLSRMFGEDSFRVEVVVTPAQSFSTQVPEAPEDKGLLM